MFCHGRNQGGRCVSPWDDGVPAGGESYITTMLDTKVNKFKEITMKDFLGMVHSSLTLAAANRMDSIVCNVMEKLEGIHIPL